MFGFELSDLLALLIGVILYLYTDCPCEPRLIGVWQSI